MGIGGSLLELGRFLDTCERRRAVDSVDLAADCSPGATGRMVADVELTLSTRPSSGGSPAVSLDGGSIDDDGRIQLAFESVDGILPERPAGVDVELGDATFDDDGTITVTLTASSTVEDDGSVAGTAAADGGARAGGHVGGAIGRSAARTRPAPSAKEDGASADRSSDGSTDQPDGWSSDGSTEQPEGSPSTRADEESSDRVEGGAVERPGDGSSEASGNGSGPGPDDEGTGRRSDRSVPPFSDPDLLEDVYESCDTFAEMPDALGMDVTAETVRRYMIDHGIHEPDSYDTDEGADDDPAPDDTAADSKASGDGSSKDTGSDDACSEGPRADDPDIGSPVVLTDGIGLPEDVTVDTLVDVVQRSNTIYEVTTEMGIDREEAVEMLQRLDLAEYVTGRLALAGEREVTRDLVLERLQRHAEQA